MTPETKTPLTGAQKVAIVLMNMDQRHAAKVMKQFSEAESDEITAEIVRMRRVEPELAERTMSEFRELTARSITRTRGGRDVAVGVSDEVAVLPPVSGGFQ